MLEGGELVIFCYLMTMFDDCIQFKWIFVFLFHLIFIVWQEIPEAFLQAYGPMLSNKVTAFMGDGSKYQLSFCKLNNLLFGLRGLFSKHALGENFYVFFDYVGPSHMYLSFYNLFCMNIFHGNPNQKFLKDIRTYFVSVRSDSTDSTDESSDLSDSSDSSDSSGTF